MKHNRSAKMTMVVMAFGLFSQPSLAQQSKLACVQEDQGFTTGDAETSGTATLADGRTVRVICKTSAPTEPPDGELSCPPGQHWSIHRRVPICVPNSYSN